MDISAAASATCIDDWVTNALAEVQEIVSRRSEGAKWKQENSNHFTKGNEGNEETSVDRVPLALCSLRCLLFKF